MEEEGFELLDIKIDLIFSCLIAVIIVTVLNIYAGREIRTHIYG